MRLGSLFYLQGDLGKDRKMDEYGKTVSMSEAIAEWSAETELEALRAAADKLDWSGFETTASNARARFWRSPSSTPIGSSRRRSAEMSWKAAFPSKGSPDTCRATPGRSFGMLAGEIALQQAEADLDSLFFDSGDFEERFLRGVADYDVENALKRDLGVQKCRTTR